MPLSEFAASRVFWDGVNPVQATSRAPERNLDVLRALAVLLVVGDHSAKFFGAPPAWCDPIGGIGVKLFFVHTCFVLMLSLERQTARSSRHVSREFYLRRFFRIYPLSICAVLGVTLFAIPAAYISGPWQIAASPHDLPTVLSNLALTMNLTGATPILGQLWSLPLEVQMYLLLPALFFFARKTTMRTMAAVWVAAVGVALFQEYAPVPGMWRLTLAQYLPCFIPGVMAYVGLRRGPRFGSALWIPTIVTLCAISYGIGSQAGDWLLCLAIGCLAPQFEEMSRRAVTIAAHHIATYSYGLYLAHVFCLWLAFTFVRAPFPVQIVLWIAGLFLVPFAAYHVIEAPAIRLGVRVARGSRAAVEVPVAAASASAP